MYNVKAEKNGCLNLFMYMFLKCQYFFQIKKVHNESKGINPNFESINPKLKTKLHIELQRMVGKEYLHFFHIPSL